MQVNIEIINEVKIKLPVEKFIGNMLSVLPDNDIFGLEKILVRNKPPKDQAKRFNDPLQAYYYRNETNNKGYIEIFLDNIINISIPLYAFEIYTEMGGLLLSEIIFHEIGHHVHFTKRHGVKKKEYEKFADNYAKKGYIAYFKSRASKILSSYRWASLDIFSFNKTERLMFTNARQELIMIDKDKN